MRKIDLVEKVINEEFSGVVLEWTPESFLDYLLEKHHYLFDRHYVHSRDYEGSEAYFQLYACITGVMNDLVNAGTDGC